MADVLIFVVVIIVAARLIYFVAQFLLGLFFGVTSGDWVSLIYKNHSEVDLDKIKKFVSDGVFPKESFTHWEIVGSFGLFLLKDDVSEVVKKAEVYGDQGWEKMFNYDFYNEIAIVAKKISGKGKKKSARKLIMFGQRLAERYNETEWAKLYWQMLNKEHSEWASLEWDASRRVRF